MTDLHIQRPLLFGVSDSRRPALLSGSTLRAAPSSVCRVPDRVVIMSNNVYLLHVEIMDTFAACYQEVQWDTYLPRLRTCRLALH